MVHLQAVTSANYEFDSRRIQRAFPHKDVSDFVFENMRACAASGDFLTRVDAERER